MLLTNCMPVAYLRGALRKATAPKCRYYRRNFCGGSMIDELKPFLLSSGASRLLGLTHHSTVITLGYPTTSRTSVISAMDLRQLVVRYVDEQLAAEEEGGEQEQVTDNKGLYVLLPNHFSQKTRGFQNPACYTPPSSGISVLGPCGDRLWVSSTNQSLSNRAGCGSAASSAVISSHRARRRSKSASWMSGDSTRPSVEWMMTRVSVLGA
ncbi:hypothetical protein PI126_g22078, partial [Phytophthora idaei]